MNDTQLLERLTSAYATVEAPTPSAALAEVLEAGGRDREVDDEARDAVVVPLVRSRTRVRVRHLVAAVVATFVLFGGLAVAGALPDAVQRQVSSLAAHLGVDLPGPDAGPTREGSDAPGGADRTRPTATSIPTATPRATGATTGASPAGVRTQPGAPGATTPGGLPVPGIGGVTGDIGGPIPTTQPPSGDGLLPALTVPPVTLPPVTVPQVTLPPVTVPQLPLPPLPAPLPLLGL